MTDLRAAAQQLLGALDKSLYMNDYCGLEVSKHDQPDVTNAIENLRAALAEPEPCQYPDCVDNGPEGKCTRWLLAECSKSEDYKPKRPAEPVQEPDSPERRCGGPGCDGACCQPVQEPIGYLWPTGRHPEFRFTQQKRDGIDGTPVYTSPPQRKPLTEEEIHALRLSIPATTPWLDALVLYTRAVERAHGIGGEG